MKQAKPVDVVRGHAAAQVTAEAVSLGGLAEALEKPPRYGNIYR